MRKLSQEVDNRWQDDSSDAQQERYQLFKNLLRSMATQPERDQDGYIRRVASDIVLAPTGKSFNPFFWKLLDKVFEEDEGLRDQINAEYILQIVDINDRRSDGHRA